MYIYIINKLLREQPNANPMAWYEKNMLSEDSMFDVDESVDESKSSNEDPIASDELMEMISNMTALNSLTMTFSRLLYDPIVW